VLTLYVVAFIFGWLALFISQATWWEALLVGVALGVGACTLSGGWKGRLSGIPPGPIAPDFQIIFRGWNDVCTSS
jgi:hypothetical protein